MGKIAEMSMEELVENLVDDIDENLEASGEVVIPTNWQEQETHKTIEVRAEEEEDILLQKMLKSQWNRHRSRQKSCLSLRPLLSPGLRKRFRSLRR